MPRKLKSLKAVSCCPTQNQIQVYDCNAPLPFLYYAKT